MLVGSLEAKFWWCFLMYSLFWNLDHTLKSWIEPMVLSQSLSTPSESFFIYMLTWFASISHFSCEKKKSWFWSVINFSLLYLFIFHLFIQSIFYLPIVCWPYFVIYLDGTSKSCTYIILPIHDICLRMQFRLVPFRMTIWYRHTINNSVPKLGSSCYILYFYHSVFRLFNYLSW